MNKIFLDLDGTIAKFNVKNALERFDKEIGFFANLGAYKGVEKVNELALKGNVFIISASPNEQADRDKMAWIDKYLSNVPKANITLCRLGQNKAKIIENKYNFIIDKKCFLLDDYGENLIEWSAAGGTPIKRITSIAPNKRKRFTLTCKDLTKLAEIIL